MKAAVTGKSKTQKEYHTAKLSICEKTGAQLFVFSVLKSHALNRSAFSFPKKTKDPNPSQAIVADAQHPEAVCQKWDHRTEIAFPMAAGARQQQQHRGIL